MNSLHFGRLHVSANRLCGALTKTSAKNLNFNNQSNPPTIHDVKIRILRAYEVVNLNSVKLYLV